ncbi:MAG: nuclear transport factor 2 family protein [Cyclobacteriaceae bacterium]
MLTQLSVFGQSEEPKILKVVNDLFLAMKTNDGSLAASLFTDDAILQTIITREDSVYIQSSNTTTLVDAFGKPKEQTWSEPIWNTKVLMDGSLATVWTDYAFYFGNQFSHCGVDVFHLVKTDSGTWKIFHLVDTRRKKDCDIPKDIVSQYR